MKLSKLTDKEIVDIVFPIAEHTENSWNQKNYHEFSRYLLNEDPDRKLTEEEFDRQLNENYDIFGQHKIGDLVALHRNPDNIIVLWKVNFEKRKDPGLLIYKFTEYKGDILILGCTYHG